MIATIRKWFSRKPSRGRAEHISRTYRKIGAIVNGTASRVFRIHGKRLLNERLTYIVPAVWGASMDGGDLTALQRSINCDVAPAVDEAMNELNLRQPSPSQDFAVEYLLRGLLVYKISYMIEATKNRIREGRRPVEDPLPRLEDMDPLGRA